MPVRLTKAAGKAIAVLFLLLILTFANAHAGPSDYSLRAKLGPSFGLSDWGNQFRLGGEFDYEFGYSLGFNLSALFGVSNRFRFDLIPAVRFNYFYIGPASMFVLGGVGLGVFGDQSALDFRFGTGLTLPLGDSLEFNTDVNLFFAPVGTPGTPVSLDWLLSLGGRFH